MSDRDVMLLPVGVGEAFTALHFTTCLAFGSGDDWILLDCPHPIRRMLRDASVRSGLSLDLDRIQAVALSHLHADHASGLEDYLYYSYFVLNRKALIATHPACGDRVWPNLLAGGMDRARINLTDPAVEMKSTDFFDLLTLDESKPVKLGPFSIECRSTGHSIPTTAFRIELGGRTLGFSADTPHDPDLIEWLAPCDLIVHEVTKLPESPVHTPYRHLAELPEALRAKMRLFHYSDDFDAEPRAIELLREGGLISLGPRRIQA